MMSKKDEALKKCLRVLNPIADEKMYETQWVDSAIRACHEALEEKEWQGLSKKDKALKCAIQTLKPWHNREIKTLLDFSGAIKVCEEALGENCQECEALKHDLDGYMQANKEMLNKEWQGLTDDEIEYEFRESEAWQVPMTKDGKDKQERRYYVFVKACKIAEQKLKEKNHGTT